MQRYLDVLRVFGVNCRQSIIPAIMLLGSILPQAVSAQTVTLEVDQVPLRQAFASLERQSSLRFVFDDALVEGVVVSVRCEDCTPLIALEKLLIGLPLRFEARDGLVVLLRADPRFNVSGVVVDKDSGEALPLAHIYLGRSGVAANRHGEFMFETIEPGTHMATVRYLGFRQLSVAVEVPLEGPLVFRLKRVAANVGSILVQGAPTVPIDDRPGQATTIGLKGMMTVPGIGGGDPLSALVQLPGVDGSEESATGLYIHGSTPDDNLLEWEGIPLFNGEHFFGMVSAFSPDVVGAVRMYMRGSPAHLGGRTGGFVLLDGAPALGQLRLAASVSPLFAGVSGRFPLGSRAGVLVSFRRSMPTLSQSGVYRTYFDSVLGSASVGQVSPGFQFRDFSARVVALVHPRHLIGVNLHSGEDILRQTLKEGDDLSESQAKSGFAISEMEESTENQWFNTGVSAVWTGSWTDRSHTNGTVSFSRYSNRYRFNRETDGDEGDLRANNDVHEARLSLRHEWDIADWVEARGGLFAKRYEVHFTGENSANGGSELSEEANASVTGSYLETGLSLWRRRLITTVGLRGSWYDQTSRGYLEPRVQLVLRVNSTLSIEGSLGRYHQFLSRVLGSDVLTESRDRWDLADKANPPARSTQRSLRVHAVRGDVTASLELFRNSLVGVDELSRRRDLTEPERTTGSGIASGFEGQIRYSRARLNAWATYSRSRIRYRFASVNDNQPFAPLHARPHNVRLALELSAGPWALGTRFTWASGRPAVIPDGSRSIDPLGTIIDSRSLQGARLADYQRWDLQLRRTLRMSGLGAEVELALVNLLDRKNVRNRRYSVVADQVQFREVHLLGFTPVLTIRVGNSRL